MRDDGDGMVMLNLLVRAEHGLAILHRAERQTRHDDGSGRTRDQRRAGWVVDTLLAEIGSIDADDGRLLLSTAKLGGGAQARSQALSEAVRPAPTT